MHLLTGKYIGVNSFGFGGVNGHVILEPYVDMNKEEFVQGIYSCMLLCKKVQE